MSTRYGISWIYDEFRVCKFQRGKLVDTWSSSSPVKNHDDLNNAIKSAAKKIGIKPGSEVAIAFESDVHTHSFLELPPMSKKDIELYLANHIEKEKTFSSEASWSYRSTPHGSKGEGVLLHLMPKNVLDKIIHTCEANQLEPRKLLPLTDVMAAHIPSLPSHDDGIIILIALFNQHIEIVVADGQGESYFVRELNLYWSIDNLERLRLEIERTHLYTKQQFHAASHIWIMGEKAHEVATQLKDSFDIPIEEDPKSSKPEFWSHEVGSLSNKSTSNFIPNSLQSTITRRTAIRFGVWVAAASLLVAIATTIISKSMKMDGNQSLIQEIAALEDKKNQLENHYKHIEQKNKKLNVLTDKPQPIAAWFLYALGNGLPNAMYLSSASLEKENDRYMFKLNGATNPTLADSASTIAELESYLRSPPWNAQISPKWKDQWLEKLQQGKASSDSLIAFQLEGYM